MPTVRSNGINLYYELHGSGEPLLFIHGLGSSTRDWEQQVPAFAARFRVITFDLRGHGRSDKPAGPYSMEMFAADTVGLLEALDIGRAHVVGLSLGGGIACQLAVSAAHAVRTLTIVNSAPELIVRSLKDRLMLWQRLGIVRLLGMRRMGEVISTRLFIGPEHETLRATFADRWAENDPRAYLASLRAMVGWSVTAQLGAIRSPTLVLTADHDYTPVSVKQDYCAAIPHARLVVIPDSRHGLPMERPAEFNEAVLAFLESEATAIP